MFKDAFLPLKTCFFLGIKPTANVKVQTQQTQFLLNFTYYFAFSSFSAFCMKNEKKAKFQSAFGDFSTLRCSKYTTFDPVQQSAAVQKIPSIRDDITREIVR